MRAVVGMKDERFEIILQTGKGIYRNDVLDTACVDPTNPDLSTRGSHRGGAAHCRPDGVCGHVQMLPVLGPRSGANVTSRPHEPVHRSARCYAASRCG